MMTGIFSPQYFGSIYYYASLAACNAAVIDLGTRYDKRFKSVHRCDIAGTGGLLRLTVPLSHNVDVSIDSGRGRQWSQMRVSSHGGWWSDHRVSLESAYGRTPYFEFYIDRFLPWLSDINIPITEFDAGIDKVLREALCISTPVDYCDFAASEKPDVSAVSEKPDVYADMRRNNFGKHFILQDIPYYQVRADRLGFIPGLSVLDLLFNMGPESPLVLRDMIRGSL